MIDLTILSGFLGAGKTTLLNHLLSSDLDRKVAVLVNDFGEINIDAELIADQDDSVIRLANGCICCTIGGSLMQTLLQLKRRPEPPEHLLIEASGVADPWKIAQVGLAGHAYRLDGIIGVADAEHVREHAEDQYVGDIVRRQIEVSDFVILNKCDLVSVVERAAVRAWIVEQAPGAQILETTQSQLSPAVLLGTNAPERLRPEVADDSDTGHVHHDHDTVFDSWSFVSERPLQADALQRLFDDLPANVLRAKGFVALDEAPEQRMLLQAVGRRWRLTPAGDWGSEAPATRLVFIGRKSDVDVAALDRRLHAAQI